MLFTAFGLQLVNLYVHLCEFCFATYPTYCHFKADIVSTISYSIFYLLSILFWRTYEQIKSSSVIQGVRKLRKEIWRDVLVKNHVSKSFYQTMKWFQINFYFFVILYFLIDPFHTFNVAWSHFSWNINFAFPAYLYFWKLFIWDSHKVMGKKFKRSMRVFHKKDERLQLIYRNYSTSTGKWILNILAVGRYLNLLIITENKRMICIKKS